MWHPVNQMAIDILLSTSLSTSLSLDRRSRQRRPSHQHPSRRSGSAAPEVFGGYGTSRRTARVSPRYPAAGGPAAGHPRVRYRLSRRRQGGADGKGERARSHPGSSAVCVRVYLWRNACGRLALSALNIIALDCGIYFAGAICRMHRDD